MKRMMPSLKSGTDFFLLNTGYILPLFLFILLFFSSVFHVDEFRQSDTEQIQMDTSTTIITNTKVNDELFLKIFPILGKVSLWIYYS